MNGLKGVKFKGLRLKADLTRKGYIARLKDEWHVSDVTIAKNPSECASLLFRSGNMGFDSYFEVKEKCSIQRYVKKDLCHVEYTLDGDGRALRDAFESLSDVQLETLLRDAGVRYVGDNLSKAKHGASLLYATHCNGRLELPGDQSQRYPELFYNPTPVCLASGRDAVWYALTDTAKSIVVLHVHKLLQKMGWAIQVEALETLLERWGYGQDSFIDRRCSKGETLLSKIKRVPHSMIGEGMVSSAHNIGVHLYSGEWGAYWVSSSGYTTKLEKAGIFELPEATSLVSHVGAEKHIFVEFTGSALLKAA